MKQHHFSGELYQNTQCSIENWNYREPSDSPKISQQQLSIFAGVANLLSFVPDSNIFLRRCNILVEPTGTTIDLVKPLSAMVSLCLILLIFQQLPAAIFNQIQPCYLLFSAKLKRTTSRLPNYCCLIYKVITNLI